MALDVAEINSQEELDELGIFDPIQNPGAPDPDADPDDEDPLNSLGEEDELDEEGNPKKPVDNPADKDDPKKPKADPDKPNEGYKPGTYLEAMTKSFEIPFNPDQIPADFTAEQELKLVQDLATKLVKNSQAAVKDADTLAKLYKEDQEVQEFIRARAEGKSIREFIDEYSQKLDYADPVELVQKYLKEEQGFSADEAKDLVDELKAKGKFDARAQSVTKFYKDVEAAQISAAEERQKLEYEQHIEKITEGRKQYAVMLNSTEKINDFVLTKEIKEDLFKYATFFNEDGLTPLEQDLQSDENVLKASLAIKYWPKIVQALKGAANNTQIEDLLERLTTSDPSKLQSDSRKQSKSDIHLEALNTL